MRFFFSLALQRKPLTDKNEITAHPSCFNKKWPSWYFPTDPECIKIQGNFKDMNINLVKAWNDWSVFYFWLNQCWYFYLFAGQNCLHFYSYATWSLTYTLGVRREPWLSSSAMHALPGQLKWLQTAAQLPCICTGNQPWHPHLRPCLCTVYAPTPAHIRSSQQ